MSSLMDRINKGMTAQPSTSSGIGQKQIADVLRAKSGKAGGGQSAPAADTILEDTAIRQSEDTLRQGSLQGALAGAGMREKEAEIAGRKELSEQQLKSKGKMAREGMQAESKMAAAQRNAREDMARNERSANENMKLDSMEASAAQRLRDLTTQREINLDNIFGEFDRSNKQLHQRRDQVELEQLGFDLAMSDRAYIDELNRIGRERLLTNDLQFSEESARITLGDNLEAVIQSLDWGRAFNGDARNWQEKLASIDLNAAMAMEASMVKGANEAAMYKGAGDAMSAGIKYGASEGYLGDTAKTNYESAYLKDKK